jgi:flagellar basal body-associated protein FliL
VKPNQSVSRPNIHKRNKIALLLTFPIVVFSWVIGWSLYWIGRKEKAVKPKKMSVNEELTTTVTIPEMAYAIQHRADA